ncbi:folylpolyglutamate synthase/dihydrofolate synthase family protein [Granulicatella sp. 20925_1_45]|uniref:bifunctional folylpolyglutamate synthase/dihydrofolate synthase n=1 Tax=Granulicatella sp. 20925_1_45 TaxID=3003685 RepID=UPI00352C2CEC
MIQEWLKKSESIPRKHGLYRMEAIIEALGNPERGLKSIHIAGTNGKGSTAAMVTAFAKAHGLRVGTFTSPHMDSIRERIQLDGVPLEEEPFWQAASVIREVESRLFEEWEAFNYFEILTAMMFVVFQQEAVDLAIIEVGIGGLLDNTNVGHPLVSVITTIGLDHQDLLGSTLEEITAQKAGIIKAGQQVVVGPVTRECMDVIRGVASEKGATVQAFGEDFSLVEDSYQDNELTIPLEQLALKGAFQKENATVAIRAFREWMEATGRSVQPECIDAALRVVSWPGRMEVLQETPLVIIDGAHNLPAIERLVQNMTAHVGKKQTLLFSALTRKDSQQMLAKLQEALPDVNIILTSFHPSKGQSIARSDVEAYLDSRKISYEESFEEVIDRFASSTDDESELWVTGSLYFIAEVRHWWKNRKPKEE